MSLTFMTLLCVRINYRRTLGLDLLLKVVHYTDLVRSCSFDVLWYCLEVHRGLQCLNILFVLGSDRAASFGQVCHGPRRARGSSDMPTTSPPRPDVNCCFSEIRWQSISQMATNFGRIPLKRILEAVWICVFFLENPQNNLEQPRIKKEKLRPLRSMLPGTSREQMRASYPRFENIRNLSGT